MKMVSKRNLEDKIEKLKLARNKVASSKAPNNLSSSMNIGIEIVSGVLVGVIIGTFFDKLFTSKPIFLIICMLLGILTSFRNIWLKIKNNGSS